MSYKTFLIAFNAVMVVGTFVVVMLGLGIAVKYHLLTYLLALATACFICNIAYFIDHKAE
jgi:uncharacterized membrane protein YdjX (TVP38/TMEM64 family)